MNRLTLAGLRFALPRVNDDGSTRRGTVAGGHAEVQYAGLHKSWTATRLIGAVSTMGFSLLLGRKTKGAATLVVTYGNGSTVHRRLKPRELAAAQAYAARFNGFAAGLAYTAASLQTAKP